MLTPLAIDEVGQRPAAVGDPARLIKQETAIATRNFVAFVH